MHTNMEIEGEVIRTLEEGVTSEMALKAIAESGTQEDAFYIMDAGEVLRKHELWIKTLPRVKPFYAVKCNDSPVVLRLLNALGTGFDCASKGEIQKVLGMGVPPERVIFANPARPVSHLKFAYKMGVSLLTFDSEVELHKVKQYHPRARLVLRLLCDATDSQSPQGLKFGATVPEAVCLIKKALSLGLELAGVSFHVGSGCREPSSFPRGVRAALGILTLMKRLGASPTILDIGGGFTSDFFLKVAPGLNEALSCVPPGLTVMAEPGRFYVESAYSLATIVHGIREAKRPEYYVNDGVYGSFNCVLYDHAAPHPQPLSIKGKAGDLKESVIWGPTCDSLDMVTDSAFLPSLQVGDWLMWANMGAYTLAAASTFNGFPVPQVIHVASRPDLLRLRQLFALDTPEEEELCPPLPVCNLLSVS